ncbi:MAG: hypothetical protein R3250_17590, partial [Melioribacteraceae bacterium]|nr:hypothetical protein [Melioribacteraceae bacterium]
VEITDSMITELPKQIDKPFLNKTLEAHETFILTIGILRPSRTNLCSATPYAMLEYSDRGIFPDCGWAMHEGQSIHPIAIEDKRSPLALGLKVGFCTVGEEYETCTIIPCGKISYS